MKSKMNGQIMHIDLHIDDSSERSIFAGAQQVLKSLRPDWEPEYISFKMLTDGITNKLVRCKVNGCADHEAVLVRIYGNKTDLLIDRKAETRNIQMLNRFDLAPTLYATFTNGLAYEFVPGCTLTASNVREPQIYRLVARHMARLHKISSDEASTATAGRCIKTTPMVWRKMDTFLHLMPEIYSRENIQKRVLELEISKQRLQMEVAELKSHLSKWESPVVFCHNDLLLGNVIYTTTTATSAKVSFIDFEYADWNFQAYDIGNHFAEFAGIENVDYDNYPSRELQYAWLKEYAQEFAVNCADQIDIDELYVQVNQFALASHLLWGIWALIQAEHSYLEFDFVDYASLRLKEYFRRKPEFLSLRASL